MALHKKCLCIKCGEEKIHYAKGVCKKCYCRHFNRKTIKCKKCGKTTNKQRVGVCLTCYERGRDLDYRKSRKLKENFGITQHDYMIVHESQNGCCAICGKQETTRHQSGTLRMLSVDHDHKTGKLRGLLCSKCNLGIGEFDDNPELLEAASNYLESFISDVCN